MSTPPPASQLMCQRAQQAAPGPRGDRLLGSTAQAVARLAGRGLFERMPKREQRLYDGGGRLRMMS
jgi:hypothetical protein